MQSKKRRGECRGVFDVRLLRREIGFRVIALSACEPEEGLADKACGVVFPLRLCHRLVGFHKAPPVKIGFFLLSFRPYSKIVW